MATELPVFISSKMRELAPERKLLQELIPTLVQDAFKLRTWAFEGDAPASNKPIRDIYLQALQNSALYIGLFWNEFGEWTIDEFERATEWGIERHLYVKNVDPEKRDSRLQAFLDKQSDVRFGITPRWFSSIDELREQVARSIEKWLLERQIAYHSTVSGILAEIPDDVPEQAKSLIGRESLVAEAAQLLDENMHVLLRGFGGMGKSALAATVAAQYVSQGKGSVLWLRAGAAEADMLFEAIARIFDAQQALVSASGDARLQVVRRLLTDTRALLVLDDVWNGAALARMIKATPRQMPVLVTSRHRFPLDEIIEVGELQPDQALQLLNLHVRGRKFLGDPDAMRLCEVVGYHTYALEIASKTLKVYQLSPADLLQRIQEAPHELNMPANFGEQGRAGIKSLLDASVNALSKSLHDVFVMLGGMFEPSATPELLALAMNLASPDGNEMLSQLELRGLVSTKTFNHVSYYRLHDLAYSYARTMFLSKGLSNQPIIEACRNFSVAEKDNVDILDVEQSNILEAAEAAHHSHRDDLLIDMMRSLTVDGHYFAARGYSAISIKLVQFAADAAKARNDLETAHYLLSRLGNAYADFMGDYAAALNAYKDALELAQRLGYHRREAILSAVIGKMRFHQKAEDADDYYARAEAIARQAQDDFALSFVLHHRGYQFINQGVPDYKRGWELSDEAAQLAAKLDLPEIHFWSLLNRGSCEHELDQVERALATHREAYELARGQNNHYWMAGALRSMGEDYHRLNNRDSAQQTFDAALTLWRQVKARVQASDLTNYMKEKGYT